MKLKLAMLGLFLTGLAEAQIKTVLTPFGNWSICQNNPSLAADIPALCPAGSELVTGKEAYLLLIQGASNGVIGFSYTIKAQMLDGSSRSFSGVFMRNDQGGKLSASHVEIESGQILSAVVEVQELVGTSLQEGNAVVIGGK